MTASRAPLRQIAARPIPRSIPQRKVKPKPTSQAQLLQRLQVIQHISVATALSLTSLGFIFYGWTVYTQKQWNEQYSKLENFKQIEGRLINAAEALDHDQLKREWEGGNLIRATPDRVIFVEGMPPRPPVVKESLPQPTTSSLPVAY